MVLIYLTDYFLSLQRLVLIVIILGQTGLINVHQYAPHRDVRLTVLDLSGNVLFESTDSIAGQSHKNAVIMHGGTITASNREGGGLQFDFTLFG